MTRRRGLIGHSIGLWSWKVVNYKEDTSEEERARTIFQDSVVKASEVLNFNFDLTLDRKRLLYLEESA